MMRFFDATSQFKNEAYLRQQLARKLESFLSPVNQSAVVKSLFINTSNRAKAEFTINGEPYRCFIDIGNYRISATPQQPQHVFLAEPIIAGSSIYDVKKMIAVTEENRAKHFEMEYDRALTA